MRRNIMTACLVVLAVCVFNLETFGREKQKMNTLVLAQDGKANAMIVIATNATRVAQFAAFELQAHLRELTGATVPILDDQNSSTGGVRILVGESAGTKALGLTNDSFTPQEYLIRFLPDKLVLMGRDKADTGTVHYDMDAPGASMASWPDVWDERGTLNAVYDFLERHCNVRWFNPTETGTDCPRSATLEVNGPDIRRAPAFAFRDDGGPTIYNDYTYDAYTALWSKDSDEFKAYEAAAYPKLHAKFAPKGANIYQANTYLWAKRASDRLFQLRRRNGGERAECNHSFCGYYERFWEKGGRPGVFVEKRPDFFAQGYEDRPRPPQLCYTSTGLIYQVAQDARDYFDGRKTGWDLCIFWRPERPNPFPLEPMDDDCFCKCDRCQARLKSKLGEEDVPFPHFSRGIHSEYFFGFVNAVAQEASKTHPHDRFATLAYMTHAYPSESFRLAPNVDVQFCFTGNRMPYQEEYAHELGLLKRWAQEKETSKRRLYLWLYNCFPQAVASKFHCFPGFFAHTIGEQFKLFHNLGVRGIYHCGNGQEVEAYLTYRLMDDPTLDVDALLDDYFARLYGPAGDALKQFYLTVERIYTDPANYRKEDRHQTMDIAWGKLGTPERMEKLRRLMETARAAADTEIRKQRVELFDKSVWSYMLAGRRQFDERGAAPPPPSFTAPKISPAGGDPAKVAWEKAVALPGPWHVDQEGKPSARNLAGRIAHDAEFLYIELTDPVSPKDLQSAAAVFPCDTWEIFVASQRAQPYRQYAVGPSGLTACLSDGEVNWRQNVPMEGLGFKAFSDVSNSGKWIVRAVVPLKTVVLGGVAPGGKLFLNIGRVTNGKLAGCSAAFAVDTWVPFTAMHQVDRLAEVTLER